MFKSAGSLSHLVFIYLFIYLNYYERKGIKLKMGKTVKKIEKLAGLKNWSVATAMNVAFILFGAISYECHVKDQASFRGRMDPVDNKIN